MIERRYLSAVRKYYIDFTTLYYVNHLYIFNTTPVLRCIHCGLYRSWYRQAASHFPLSLLLQSETARITDNGSRRCCRVVISKKLLAVKISPFSAFTVENGGRKVVTTTTLQLQYYTDTRMSNVCLTRPLCKKVLSAVRKYYIDLLRCIMSTICIY